VGERRVISSAPPPCLAAASLDCRLGAARRKGGGKCGARRRQRPTRGRVASAGIRHPRALFIQTRLTECGARERGMNRWYAKCKGCKPGNDQRQSVKSAISRRMDRRRLRKDLERERRAPHQYLDGRMLYRDMLRRRPPPPKVLPKRPP
jgi:hypothetical protein